MPIIQDNPTNKIKLAVVIPCYNEEENIQQVITSYTKQNHKDFTLILVDNNSKDNTSKIIKQCQNTLNIEIIKLIETEQGVSAARKCGYDYCIANGYTHVISSDADTIVGPNFVQKYYDAFNQAHEVISGDTNWDASSQIPFQNIQYLLYSKFLVEDLIVDIYGDKMEGFNSGFSLDAYQEVGGIDKMKYIYRDKIYPSASDDWCLHAKFLSAGFYVETLDTKDEVTFNFRKYLTSIQNMLEGTLYDKGWENLNAQEKSKHDISIKDMKTLFQKFSRSAIVNFMLMHCYLQPELLDTQESTKLLGNELSNKIHDAIWELKSIYPYNKYNDHSSFFAPSIHLYFKFGEEITDKINDYFQYIEYNKPLEALQYIEYPKITKIKKKNNLTELDDQILYLICTQEDIFDFFSEN